MNKSDTSLVLQANAVYKSFAQGPNEICVLEGVNLAIGQGERIAILGRSGSGKSTLMHILAGLDSPDSGTIDIAGTALLDLSPDQKAAIRADHMGFVYQNHHLLAEFTAEENVSIPLRIAGKTKVEALEMARETLSQVGLENRMRHIPGQLSGGERQRVAVARAIATRPDIVLADEPTGNLDIENAQQIMQLIGQLSDQHGVAFLVVTHDIGSLDSFHSTLRLDGGILSAYP
ncbi:MAG: ABC transporter ATP-binding protein [Pseudomonadota bacterium]